MQPTEGLAVGCVLPGLGWPKGLLLGLVGLVVSCPVHGHVGVCVVGADLAIKGY